MFQPISADDLHYNKKYKISGLHDYSGIYKGKVWYNELFLEFHNVRNLTCKDEIYLHTRVFLPCRLFYEFVSQKERIQWDMELRALNQIIRRVLGDDHFSW